MSVIQKSKLNIFAPKNITREEEIHASLQAFKKDKEDGPCFTISLDFSTHATYKHAFKPSEASKILRQQDR